MIPGRGFPTRRASRVAVLERRTAEVTTVEFEEIEGA